MIGWKNDRGVYLIAEIGGNHEGDFDYAMRLASLACETGVDAVKFQIYTGDTLVSEVESPERHAHFKRFELSREQYVSLAEVCPKTGLQTGPTFHELNARNHLRIPAVMSRLTANTGHLYIRVSESAE